MFGLDVPTSDDGVESGERDGYRRSEPHQTGDPGKVKVRFKRLVFSLGGLASRMVMVLFMGLPF